MQYQVEIEPKTIPNRGLPEPHDIELHYEADGIVGWYRNMAVRLDDCID